MTASARPPFLALVGPTGTGKSAVALAVAEALGGEIVGCDALQVYRGFDLGTAKPGAADRARVPHHLVDTIEPARDFSMADWVRAAEEVIAGIAERGRVPLVVGGTGLYLRGLLRGFIEAPGRNDELRRRLRAVGQRRGLAFLHHWLRRIDPASGARIAPADGQRIVRALELALDGGPVWSERLRESGTWADSSERYRCLKLGLDLEREALKGRLDQRVEAFFEAGLVAEVRALIAAGLSPEANAFKAIGYREVLDALCSGEDPDGVREAVRRSTRRYAKRQRTWFRAEPGVVWLDATGEAAAVAAEVVRRWRGFARTGRASPPP